MARHGKWTYFACGDCRTMELCPVPTELELQRYYNSEYSVPCTEAHYQHYESISRKLLASIGTYTPVLGTLLEIGCSHGAFLLQARAAGWDVTGIEISEEASTNARTLGLKVLTGTLEQNASSLGMFDCIVAWHVIEHIVDVHRFFETVKPHLKPGGLLALRTPNARALSARTIPQYWQWIGAPAHVRLFSAAGMEMLLRRHGFTVLCQSTRRGDNRAFGTDLLMALAKAVLDRKRTDVDEEMMKGNGSRAGNVPKYTDLVFRPVDWLLGINGRNMLGAELFVLARA
jgi:SAM-dependent methyltransferase